MAVHLWLRAETKPNEKRRALSPKNAKKLADLGFELTIEESTQAIFDDSEYEKLGLTMTKEGSWTNAPKDAFILGLKELPESDEALIHKHIYFAHVYKNQDGWKQILDRFKRGGGKLYDLEFLTHKNGKRVAAFGYWAGFAGAAMATALWAHQKRHNNLKDFSIKTFYNKSEDLVDELKDALDEHMLRGLITGMRGRSGTGARELFEAVGIPATGWDKKETKQGGPFKDILNYDIFVNCVLMMSEQPPFMDRETLNTAEKMMVISDVSCDPTGPFNSLPIYEEATTFAEPYQYLIEDKGVILTAIDNLPSLLPRESSHDFSNQLFEHFKDLESEKNCWFRALEVFDEKMNLI